MRLACIQYLICSYIIAYATYLSKPHYYIIVIVSDHIHTSPPYTVGGPRIWKKSHTNSGYIVWHS